MNVIQRMIKGMQKGIEIQVEINTWDILVMGIISLCFYLLAIMLPVDAALVSDISVKGVLFFKFVLFSAAVLLAFLSIAGYTRMYSARLLINILSASAGLAFLLLSVFSIVTYAKGYYFLSAWTPIFLFFASAVIMAVVLHKYWTLPYYPKDIEDAARLGYLETAPSEKPRETPKFPFPLLLDQQR